MKPTTTQEAVSQVLDGFQFLILKGRTLLGTEQYAPSRDPDASDENIRSYQEYVKALRAMREQFETLTTGGLE